MKTIFTLFSLSLSTLLLAQFSVEIKYTEVDKLDIQSEMDGIEGIDLSGLLPENMTSYKVLTFTASESVYCDDEGNSPETETDLSSDDGSIKIQFVRDESTSILYTNLTENKVIHQQGFMGKSFLVSDSPESFKWKIGTEKINYLGYECIKASTKNDKEEEIVAWFTTQIPVPAGPSLYNKLPGVILMVSLADGKKEIKATEIKTQEVNTELIKIPNDGKKVTSEEFKTIQEEKMKEMKQQYKGNNMMFEVR